MRHLPILILLAACGSTSGPTRFPVTLPEAVARVPVNVVSLEVRDAELPLYAELEEIYIQTAEGGLVSDTQLLWADDPRRTVTQGIASSLSRLTSARVAAEPWPLEDLPEARLEVRLERFGASAGGEFVMSGQYFVAREDGGDRTGRFEVAVPYIEGSLTSLAQAQGSAIAELARLIAVEALGARGV